MCIRRVQEDAMWFNANQHQGVEQKLASGARVGYSGKDNKRIRY